MKYFLILLLSSSAWAQGVWSVDEHLKLVQKGKTLVVVMSGKPWPAGRPLMRAGFHPPGGAHGQAQFILENPNHLTRLEDWSEKIQDGVQGIETSKEQGKSIYLQIWGQGAALVIDDVRNAQWAGPNNLTINPGATPILASYYLSRGHFKRLTRLVYQAQDKLRNQ
ncbi:hypothetical protein JST97_27405 [bacterium]|nr:hypothetical protein [bacterium]